MTNYEKYFGTPEKAAQMTVTDTAVKGADDRGFIYLGIVKTLHRDGQSVCVIAMDDYLEWLQAECDE